jgi:hypothetical protein
MMQAGDSLEIDSSPVQIEPDVIDEGEEDGKNQCSSLPVVASLWFLAVVGTSVSLIHRPLIMIGCLVIVNIIFPVIYFMGWFRRNTPDQMYDMLTQDEGDVHVRISVANA